MVELDESAADAEGLGPGTEVGSRSLWFMRAVGALVVVIIIVFLIDAIRV